MFSKKKTNTSCKSSKTKIKIKSFFEYNTKTNNNLQNTSKKIIKNRNNELSNLISLKSFDSNNAIDSSLPINSHNRNFLFGKEDKIIKVNTLKNDDQFTEKNEKIKQDNIIYNTENKSEYLNIAKNNNAYIKKKINMVTNLKYNPNENDVVIYKPEKAYSQRSSFKISKKYNINDLQNGKNNEIENKRESRKTFENIQIRVTKLLDLYSKIVSNKANGEIS